MNKMFKFLLDCGSKMCKRTKRDIEEGSEQPTRPERTSNDFEEDESSTSDELTEQDGEVIDKELAIILAEMKKPIVLREEYTEHLQDSFCIFRIPHSLKEIHRKGYEPETVSIGPYHNGKKHLRKIEEHKYRYLKLFLDEAKDGVDMNVLYREILIVEADIRNSYSEKLVEQSKLLNMMLLDGCFILMLFFFVAKTFEMDNSKRDPILLTPWILATIQRDLLLLENQVPLILLEILLKQSNACNFGSATLENLASKFFKVPMVKTKETRRAKHLLDLIRTNFIPDLASKGTSHNSTETTSCSQYDSRLILSAKRLRLQGIKFIKASHDHSSLKVWCKKMFGHLSNKSDAVYPKSSQEKKILEIKLNGNELHIPPIVFDGIISSLLLNCVAFEQLSMDCSNYITSYVVFMGCLMNEEADVTYLSEKGIIENYFGNGNDVCQFFKNICIDVAFDMSKSYLKKKFQGINEYTSSWWNVEFARFKHLHFDSPWTLLSSLAVLAAISLAIVQTIFGALSYLHPHK